MADTEKPLTIALALPELVAGEGEVGRDIAVVLDATNHYTHTLYSHIPADLVAGGDAMRLSIHDAHRGPPWLLPELHASTKHLKGNVLLVFVEMSEAAALAKWVSNVAEKAGDLQQAYMVDAGSGWRLMAKMGIRRDETPCVVLLDKKLYAIRIHKSGSGAKPLTEERLGAIVANYFADTTQGSEDGDHTLLNVPMNSLRKQPVMATFSAQTWLSRRLGDSDASFEDLCLARAEMRATVNQGRAQTVCLLLLSAAPQPMRWLEIAAVIESPKLAPHKLTAVELLSAQHPSLAVSRLLANWGLEQPTAGSDLIIAVRSAGKFPQGLRTHSLDVADMPRPAFAKAPKNFIQQPEKNI
jgi:hypothetical protein